MSYSKDYSDIENIDRLKEARLKSFKKELLKTSLVFLEIFSTCGALFEVVYWELCSYMSIGSAILFILFILIIGVASVLIYIQD